VGVTVASRSYSRGLDCIWQTPGDTEVPRKTTGLVSSSQTSGAVVSPPPLALPHFLGIAMLPFNP
jgi:hypothetical protein